MERDRGDMRYIWGWGQFFSKLRGLFIGMIMIDLRKVFDTVNHQILCNKLQAMGVFNIKWFQSYLTGKQSWLMLMVHKPQST
jgi:hypothetical protein